MSLCAFLDGLVQAQKLLLSVLKGVLRDCVVLYST